MNGAMTASTVADREIVITRMLNAPPELVWQALTDPNQVVQWWGPSGFRTTTKRMDVKPGGIWRFVMHGPDGRDYENMITYLEVVEPHRLTYKHGGDKDVEPVNFQVTVTFEPAGMNGERTLFTMRSIFGSNQAREFVIREYNALEGGKQDSERLDEYLRATSGAGVDGVSPSEQPFIITRVFQAPQDLLWRVWTDPTHMACWLGPTGVSIVSNKIATELERKTFDDAHGSMQQGWTGTLDRLQEYLPTQTA